MSNQAIKKWILLVFKFVVATFILTILVNNSQLEMGLFYKIIKQPYSLLAIFALFYILILFSTWRWFKLYTAQSITLTFKETILPTYFGVAFNNVLPGSVGGDFVRLFYLFKKFHTKKSAVALSIFFDRVIGLMGIFVTISAIALWRMNAFQHAPSLFYVLTLCIIFCVMGLGIFLLSLLLPQRLGFSTWLSNKFPNKKWVGPLVSFCDAVHVYRHAKTTIIQCLLISVGIQVLMAFTIVLISQMMGFAPISFVDFIIAIGAAQIANLVPLTPGGLGIGEVAFANVLLLLNPGSSAAYATIFLAFRFLGILSYLPGVILYFAHFKLPNTNIDFQTEQ